MTNILSRLLIIMAVPVLLAGCVDSYNKYNPPLPPADIQNYVGLSRAEIIKRLGPADQTISDGSTLVWHWHTRDAEISPDYESAWRGNTAFTQRQLPTRNMPLLEGCDLHVMLNGDTVTKVQTKGLCG